MSIVPGAEFDIPLTERWSLKPFGYAGYGAQLSGDASAWMYWAGLKSRLRFPGKTVSWALLNSLAYVGYHDDVERSNVLPLFTALMQQGGWGRPIAQRIYARARPGYHSVTADSVDKVVPLAANAPAAAGTN